MTISVCGLLLLASTAWRNADGYALPWALAAAFSTSVYSLSDKAATVYLPSLASVLGFISVGYALSFFAITLLLRREQGRWVPECKPPLWVMLCSGLFVGLAYVLVVHAMRTLPAATVVTFTNAGIVLAGLLSMLLFRERAHWRMRLAGMLVITAGLILLGWAHR
jgi:drug/metabolite transporter (DMT)-like permease